jgi:hypothetical protein
MARLVDPSWEPLLFTCPRCGEPAVARFVGPCGGCRAALLEQYAGSGREVAEVAYEPKMNVVPNQVATKD